MCPCTASHDPGERPCELLRRQSTSSSSPAPRMTSRSTYATRIGAAEPLNASSSCSRVGGRTGGKGSHPPAAQGALQPSGERFGAERLGQEVVGAQLEDADLV